MLPSGMRRVIVALIGCSIGLLATAGGWANVQYSATAHLFGPDGPRTEQRYRVVDQANRLQASQGALQACQRALTKADEYCELSALDGHDLITSHDIRAQVDSHSHPLFLWQLQSDTATVYLAGSIHLLKPGLYPLPKPYEEAFQRATTLVLEVDPATATPQRMQALADAHAMLPGGRSLESVLGGELFTELSGQLRVYGVEANQLAPFKPAFVTQQLAVLALLSVGYDPSRGLESYFHARLGTRRLLALETVEFQYQLLMSPDLTTQVDMTRDTLDQLSRFEHSTAALVTAWLSGDDGEVQRVIQEQAGTSPAARAFTRKLLEERNHGMARKVDTYLASSGVYFVLVGSAHLIGPQSILALLQTPDVKRQRIKSNQQLIP